MNELALFAGAGGGILGGKLLGWRTVCAGKWEPYAASVLIARQNDGILPPFPIWDDVQTFDGKPWRGRVDVVSGGFPCQDISCAGKGAGIEGARSSMWKHMARIIGEVRPRYAFVENSPMLVGRGLGMVLGHLAEMGYDTRWGIVGAHHAAAPHKRDRIWIVADSKSNGHGMGGKPGDVCEEDGGSIDGMRSITSCASEKKGDVANTESTRLERHRGNARESGISEPWNDGASLADASPSGLQGGDIIERMHGEEGGKWAGQSTGSGGGIIRKWWATEPNVGRVAHGVAARVDRLKAIGNGQVPAVVRLAWETLMEERE
jgi:DNA (cytosine-5)-methyltransferase 1